MKRQLIIIIIILLFLFTFFTLYKGAGPSAKSDFKRPEINYTLTTNENAIFTHNFTIIMDEKYEILKTLHDNTGWLLLEAELKSTLGIKISPKFEKIINRFEGKGDLWGWWPEDIIQNPRHYFNASPPTLIVVDIDDTSWGHKLKGKTIPESIISQFIFDQKLPKVFRPVCQEIGCRRDRLIRIWRENELYSQIQLDTNIVVTANTIASMDTQSEGNKLIFEENKKFINHIIENYPYRDFYEWYDPKVTGIFLMLYYDAEYQPFLSEKARGILFNDLRKDYQDLRHAPLSCIWGIGESTYGSLPYKFKEINEKVPSLMIEYLKKKWLGGDQEKARFKSF